MGRAEPRLSVRVATFNVQHGRLPGGAVDVDVLARTCVALDVDVLGLQEVDVGVRRSGTVDQAAAVAEATGMRMAFGQALRPAGGGRYGNALLVRGDISAVEEVRLPALRPAAWERLAFRRRTPEPRAGLVAAVEVDGATMSVAVCHLGLNRAESVRQLADLVGVLRRRPGPRILLGDLNRRAHQVAPFVGAAGMTLAGGDPTFPARRPVMRIDHVAFDGFEVVGVEVPPTPVSDHRPLVVELQAR